MMQSQTEFLHRPNLEMVRGNSQYPISLKVSRFGKTWTISEPEEFEGWSIQTNLCENNFFFTHLLKIIFKETEFRKTYSLLVVLVSVPYTRKRVVTASYSCAIGTGTSTGV